MSGGSKESTEKCVGLQLYLLVPTLGCHFGSVNSDILLNYITFHLDRIRAFIQSGINAFSSGLLQNVIQLWKKVTLFAGHHLDSQGIKASTR